MNNKKNSKIRKLSNNIKLILLGSTLFLQSNIADKIVIISPRKNTGSMLFKTNRIVLPSNKKYDSESNRNLSIK